MSRFTPTSDALTPALAEAETWLRRCLEREHAVRGLPASLGWSIQRGRRETGPPSGAPRLAQVGFLLRVHAQPVGSLSELSCFIAADDILDDEQRPVVEQVLGLWLDRVLP